MHVFLVVSCILCFIENALKKFTDLARLHFRPVTPTSVPRIDFRRRDAWSCSLSIVRSLLVLADNLRRDHLVVLMSLVDAVTR